MTPEPCFPSMFFREEVHNRWSATKSPTCLLQDFAVDFNLLLLLRVRFVLLLFNFCFYFFSFWLVLGSSFGRGRARPVGEKLSLNKIFTINLKNCEAMWNYLWLFITLNHLHWSNPLIKLGLSGQLFSFWISHAKYATWGLRFFWISFINPNKTESTDNWRVIMSM